MDRKIAFTIRKNNNLFYTNILINKVAMKISCCVGRYNPDLEKSADDRLSSENGRCLLFKQHCKTTVCLFLTCYHVGIDDYRSAF